MSCSEYCREKFEAFFIPPNIEVGMGAGTAHHERNPIHFILSSYPETGKFFLWVSWLVLALFHTTKQGKGGLGYE